MGRFIDDKTIWVIMNDNFNDVKEIIETEMRVSPFGKIGTRTYIVKFKNSNDEVKLVKIDDELYQKVYKEYKPTCG
jgi:hypothetical protein